MEENQEWDQALLLEYEDGKHPEEDEIVLIIQRVKNTDLPSKEEGK